MEGEAQRGAERAEAIVEGFTDLPGMGEDAFLLRCRSMRGRLTRDGLMREPRLGVVDYMLRGFWLDGQRDLVFVPLGLNYDRVLEDRTLLLSGDPEARKPGTFWAAWNTLGFAANNLRLMLGSA